MYDKLTIAELFVKLGFPFETLNFDEYVDVSEKGFETLSYNEVTGESEFALITKIVRKQSTHSYVVDDISLTVSPLHRFFAKLENANPTWIEAHELVGTNVELMMVEGWKKVTISKSIDLTEILDIEVEKNHSYFTNGVLSHNTMYGDPQVPPGGWN